MPKTVLIVDDVDINRKSLREMLCNDYEIAEASDGARALELLRRDYKNISVVLLDLIMPVMDGFEVLSQMRACTELLRIPVIVTTNSTDEVRETKALMLGANDYITKPFNSVIVKQRIQNIINLHETASSIKELERDKLTGLYNRETFLSTAEEMISQHPPEYYTMACLNIDGFKVINDRYGIEKGNEVLKHVASCLYRWIKDYGGICARVTADNFAVLYPRSLMDSDVLRENHVETTSPKCIDRQITVRIGRYVVNDLSLRASAMYDRATLAENSVRGRFDAYIAQYDESMRTHLLRRQQIISEMNSALTDGQFEPWLQPQYNHATGALVGAEVLTRWRHPSNGLILPSEFIPVFEQNGFIYELDKCMWNRACFLLRKWIDEGHTPLPISVNISRYDIFKPDLVEVLIGLVRQYDLPADLLQLEITESAFANSSNQIISVVRTLMSFGFTIEIDDFGSGYSSLNVLKDVPASVLKLDMRFLESEGTSRRGGNILEAVVRMAKRLGMSVIAEGVETLEQADYLKSIGCNYIQGFLYSRPIPVDDYESLAFSFSSDDEISTEQKLFNPKNLLNLRSDAIDKIFTQADNKTLLAFINDIPCALCRMVVHPDTRVELIFINDSFGQLFGVDREKYAELGIVDSIGRVLVEDRPILLEQLNSLIKCSTRIKCTYRIHASDGSIRWIRHTGVAAGRIGDSVIINAAFLDVTDEHEIMESLRITKEEHQIAIRHSGSIICRYTVADMTVSMNPEIAAVFGMPEAVTNVPYEPVRLGNISPESSEAYIGFYEEILRGNESGSAVFKCKTANGWRVMNARYSTVFSESGEPVSAVVSMHDITEKSSFPLER